MSETTPEDHLIVLREFLTGNKAHATSSSIRARVNCFRASDKLHLSCTVATVSVAFVQPKSSHEQHSVSYHLTAQ